MTVERPYFMQNQEWYYFDEEAFMYKLTDKAPTKAVKSYREFYDTIYGGDEAPAKAKKSYAKYLKRWKD